MFSECPPLNLKNTSSDSLAFIQAKTTCTRKVYKNNLHPQPPPLTPTSYIMPIWIPLPPTSLHPETIHTHKHPNCVPYLSSPAAVTVPSLCPGRVLLDMWVGVCVCVFTRRLLHSSPLQHSTLLVLPPAHTTSLFHQLLIQELPYPKIQHPSLLFLWYLLPLPFSPSSLTPVVLHTPEAWRLLSSEDRAGKLVGRRWCSLSVAHLVLAPVCMYNVCSAWWDCFNYFTLSYLVSAVLQW